MSRRLTPRQQEALHVIQDFLRLHRVPPTIRELGRALRMESTNGVHWLLRTLKRKGYLRIHDEIARGLVPLAPPHRRTRGIVPELGTRLATPRSTDGASPEQTQELEHLRARLAELHAELEDVQVTIDRKQRRIERLEALIAETRLAVREANLPSLD